MVAAEMVKVVDFGCILKVDPVSFPGRLDMGYERKSKSPKI